MISKEIIQSILDTARIEEVISDFVNLKKRGSNYVGLCPFHNEKTPSFSVSATKGIYKCFGCGKAGNAVNFIMEHERFNYSEALRYLAKKYSIEIEEDEPTPEYLQQQNEKESIYNVNKFAQQYFSNFLFHHHEGKAVGLPYLRERDFTDDIIVKFQLGYCNDSYNEFTNHAINHGYNLKHLYKSGLTIEKQGGEHYDRFRGRIIFPIHSLSGSILGFGARILRNDPSKPKYLNSPETDIYIKSKVLYGLYFARNAIVAADNCYLVEGYTDTISLFQNGIHNVVASSGTSLTTEQVRLIKRYTNNITILYDGDEAGLKASFKGIDLILEQGMNVRIVQFPEDEDPDSFARKHRPAEIRSFLAGNSKDFIYLKTDLLLEDVKDDPVRKAGLIKEVVGSISLIPDIITRSLYLKECAGVLSIEENTLIHEMNRILRNKYSNKIATTQTVEAALEKEKDITPAQLGFNTDSCEFQEGEIIRLLLNYGNQQISFDILNEFGHIDKQIVTVAKFIFNDLQIDDITFENDDYQNIFNQVLSYHEQNGKIPDISYIISNDHRISRKVINLVSNPHELSENWRKKKVYVNGEVQHLKETITTSLLSLKAERLQKMIKQNRQDIKQTNDHEAQIRLVEKIQRNKEILNRINRALGRVISP